MFAYQIRLLAWRDYGPRPSTSYLQPAQAAKYYSFSTYGAANGADAMLSKTQKAYVVTCTGHQCLGGISNCINTIHQD